jgi:ribosomal protein S18 acetylase RimI-like enzyme
MHIRLAQPEDAAEIAQVHVEGWRTAYRGILPADFLESLAVEPRRQFWHHLLSSPPAHAAMYVAEDVGGGVVGFALGGLERTGDPEFRGELQAIYVAEQHQLRGMGRQLVEAVARDLVQQGLTSMLVWVLRENPWRGFYEALGGRLLREREIEIADTRYPERAYGWAEAAVLLRRHHSPVGE